jgi:hypothetical protein
MTSGIMREAVSRTSSRTSGSRAGRLGSPWSLRTYPTATRIGPRAERGDDLQFDYSR